jgi:hypothetical protein
MKNDKITNDLLQLDLDIIKSILDKKFKNNEEALEAFNELPKDLVEIMIKHRDLIDDFNSVVGNSFSMISILRYFDAKCEVEQ